MRKLISIVGATFLLLLLAYSDTKETPPIFRPIVRVLVFHNGIECYHGTGFFIHKDLVVSAAHVLMANDEPLKVGDDVTLEVYDGSRVRASILIRDAVSDISVIKTYNYKSDFYLVPRFVLPKVGDELVMLGTIKEGYLRDVKRVVNLFEIKWSDDSVPEQKQLMIFFAPDSAPGTSGSALVDTEGWVIGVNVGGAYRAYGIGTPLTKIERELKELLKARQAKDKD